tara:strand:- start:298 stop:1020 length:723 start_codon:yes stop_codon:yes gene_type:complete
MRSSLNEFIERQALVGSWLGSSGVKQYDSNILLTLPKLKRLAEQLTQNGDVSIFDISNSLPGYTIVMCYFSKSKKDKVQYVIGVASSGDLIESLTSALTELWQDYIYIYCYDIDSEKMQDISSVLMFAGDSYHMNHFQDNTPQTKNRIHYFNTATHTKLIASGNKQYNHQKLLEGINKISPNVFVYQQKDLNAEFYYTRVISPDFYLHMSIHEPLNFKNRYSKSLAVSTTAKNQERIPFP